MGIRLDAGSGHPGVVITPHYDSLLCKVTGRGQNYEQVIRKLSRALKVRKMILNSELIYCLGIPCSWCKDQLALHLEGVEPPRVYWWKARYRIY